MQPTIDITINGVTYPCRMTMGAMIRFKEVTGHEVSEATMDVRDACAFIWACVTSSARREGKRFDMGFMDFCDSVDTEEMTRCWDLLLKEYAPTGEEPTEEEKKS